MLQISQQRYGKLLILRAVQTPIKRQIVLQLYLVKHPSQCLKNHLKSLIHIAWKLLSHLNFWILAFLPIFVLLKVTCLVTLLRSASFIFSKTRQMDHFWHFLFTFVHSKCKRSSLRSQCWMRLFLWFSNTLHCKNPCTCYKKTNSGYSTTFQVKLIECRRISLQRLIFLVTFFPAFLAFLLLQIFLVQSVRDSVDLRLGFSSVTLRFDSDNLLCVFSTTKISFIFTKTSFTISNH